MVDINVSEKDEAEALKQWWAENGRSVIAGVVLGIAGIVGWQQWGNYTKGRAEAASIEYELLLNAARTGKDQAVESHAEMLMIEYSSTPYAALGALLAANVKAEAGDMTAAQSHLQWAMEHAPDDAIGAIARARLIRVRIAAGDLDGAQAALPDPAPMGFIAQFAELKGDIAQVRGDVAAARLAYDEALRNLGAGDANRNIVEMKRNDLPAANS